MAYRYKVDVNGISETVIAGSYPIAANRGMKDILRKSKGLSRLGVLSIKITRGTKVQYEYIVERIFDKASGNGWIHTREFIDGPFATNEEAELRAWQCGNERPAEKLPLELGKDRHRGFQIQKRMMC